MKMNSILLPTLKGVMFVSGYRGTGKTFLAAHSELPQNIAFFDFDEGKGEGLHKQLEFGYYKPVEENQPLKRADMFLSEIEKLEQNKYTICVIDNILPLEKALQSVVYRDSKKYANIYGYIQADVMKDSFGKARGIVNDMTGDAIAKPLHAKGIKLIIVTSHIKSRYNVPGKMDIQGRDRWQDLSILTLILLRAESYPIPSAIVQKEALGNINISQNLDYEAIMRGDIPSHDISRRLPARLPKADWQSIRQYLYQGANLANPPEDEKLNLEESEPFSDKLSKEQVAYQLGILEKEKREEEEAKLIELRIKQEQDKSLKEFLADLDNLPNPIKVSEAQKAVENGELTYDNEITIAKVGELLNGS
jgi:hypothetical protein